MKKRKKIPILRWCLLALLALIIGMNLYSFNANALAGNAMPMPFGIGSAVVLSGSMEPTLSVNDYVIVQEADSYQVGDIVVYQSGNTLVIHRIIQIDGENVIARGDANNRNDEPVPLIYIKGRLVCAIPGVGGILRFVKSLPGTIVMIIGAILLLELSWRKEKNKDTEKMDAIKDEIRRLQAELEEKKGE